ncbi:hypothetical protein EMIHUDRAFT_239479 [Emiliania huxleyi CCMP1516]|uniref:Uncharacterized protein n=2 Tax=Emiliania huxleyi TaxID=2903 RepID=A0A0D3JJ88_EMIH1|nr:hypothetical protein EMIHUDRAFT_239479 [Emiliania huxleyi CCMP1516]EOD23573.1 hypothetical protein EMIHUDRAFT_239479 [Emiliania huxleyi CCMP1516]|eukprot:XP_005776002.1 hypothetical protein EMIHUDRAFT_239479 [Emiliania huxleyi CCMP1516]
MHPDGATEAIVDFALAGGCRPASGKPFAVARNICRLDKRGKRVTSYTAFVKYLVDKAPGRIGTRTLPFEGKNIVVYSLPESGGGGEGEGAMLKIICVKPYGKKC